MEDLSGSLPKGEGKKRPSQEKYKRSFSDSGDRALFENALQ